MNKIGWGLLSTANINRWLIPAIRASRRGKLMAVASRSMEKAAAYAAEWEIPHAFGSYDAMLESDVIEAVHISLPNHLHAKWSIRAMQAGKHVLCEKPLALSVAEVDQMIFSHRETGRVLAEALMYRHHPQTKIAGDWAHSGRLGEIILVWCTFNFNFGSRENIRLVPEYGGGSLWDMGIYPLSFAQFILGETPKKVYGNQWLGETGVDESFAGLFQYNNDRVAQISSSFRTPSYTFAEIIGTQGRLALSDPFLGMDDGGQMMHYPEDAAPYKVQVPGKELYLGEVEDMHAAILDGVPCYLSQAESRNHIRTVVALYESARTQRGVALG